MIRDFSQTTFERLKNQINQISEEQYCFITDFLGDLTVGAGRLVGLIDIKDDMSNVEKYHKHILDQNDTTAKELEEIFINVRGTELLSNGKLLSNNNTIQDYEYILKQLSQMISIKSNNFSADNLNNFMTEIKDTVLQNEKMVKQSLEENIAVAEKRIAEEAAKGVIKSGLSIWGKILSFPGQLIAAGYSKGVGGLVGTFTSETWGMINNVFSFGQDVVALGMIGTGRLLTCMGVDGNVRYEAIKEADAYSRRNGLKDEIEASGTYVEQLAPVVGAIDMAVDVYELYTGLDDLKESIPKAYETIENIYSTETNWYKKKKILKNMATCTITGLFGIKSMKIEDGMKAADKLKKKGNIISNIGKLYEYYTALDEYNEDGDINGVHGKILQNSKTIGIVKKGVNLYEKLDEVFSMWNTSGETILSTQDIMEKEMKGRDFEDRILKDMHNTADNICEDSRTTTFERLIGNREENVWRK